MTSTTSDRIVLEPSSLRSSGLGINCQEIVVESTVDAVVISPWDKESLLVSNLESLLESVRVTGEVDLLVLTVKKSTNFREDFLSKLQLKFSIEHEELSRLKVDVSDSLVSAMRARLEEDDVCDSKFEPSSIRVVELQKASQNEEKWRCEAHTLSINALVQITTGITAGILATDANLSRQQLRSYFNLWTHGHFYYRKDSNNYSEETDSVTEWSTDRLDLVALENDQVVGVISLDLGKGSRKGDTELKILARDDNSSKDFSLERLLIMHAFEAILKRRGQTMSSPQPLPRVSVTVSVPKSNPRQANSFVRFLRGCGFVNSDTDAKTFWHIWPKFNVRKDSITQAIPNGKPFLSKDLRLELGHLEAALKNISTHAEYGPKCEEFLTKHLGGPTGAVKKTTLVNSGTAGLQLACLTCFTCCKVPIDVTGPVTGGGLRRIEVSTPEVIMPSYTFVSTANAFVVHGACPVFVDIRSDTQNINETLIEAAITPRTRGICAVHYAGVPCEMDTIMEIARKHNLIVIEDNAHGVFGTYYSKKLKRHQYLGTIGHIGVLSFHYTKNFVCGEGGAVLVNRSELVSNCMIGLEKGTNRFDFLMGKVDRYAWVDKGCSFVMSEILAAILWSQFQQMELILHERRKIWNSYFSELQHLEAKGVLQLPKTGEESQLQSGLCEGQALTDGETEDSSNHSAHIFYIRIANENHRKNLEAISKKERIAIYTHYSPLHSSIGGALYSRSCGELEETTRCAAELYRLPLWIGMDTDTIQKVVKTVEEACSA